MKNETKTSSERLFDRIAKFPFLTVILACILLFFFGFCNKDALTGKSYVYDGVVMFIILGVLTLVGRIGGSLKESLIIFAGAMVMSAGGLYLMRAYSNSPALFLWMSLFLLASLCILLWKAGTLTERNFVMLMIAAGILLRFTYVLYTSSQARQHDVGYFNWTWGHANYIEYWYKNGLKLPEFDVTTIWQYYHPPFHHWLMALLLKILTNYDMDYLKACEALQILPMLYSALMPVVCCRIFRFVKLRGLPFIVPMAILCFHPTFVLLGGFFNNDTLCVLLMLLSVMFALKWFRKPTLLRILPIALCVGLGMMTKLSGWMVAPAIAVLFLYVFIKNIKSWYKFVGQYVLFGVICAPLGLWWQIRNLIKFKTPLTYVPFLNVNDPQCCADMPVTKRLFDFGNGQLSFVYDAFTDPNFGAKYNEYNPTIGLFKTSVFGEGQNAISDIHFRQIKTTGPILFWIAVILGVLCFVSFVIMMISKHSGLDGILRIFFSVLAVTLLGSYYAFCFKFPFTCTMNIRYCVPLIPLFAMGLGLLLRRFSGDTLPEKILRYAVCILTAAFAVMVCLVYCQIDMPVPVTPVAH